MKNKKARRLLLAQAAFLGAGGCVGDQQQGADDGNGDRVGGRGERALDEDQIGRFLIDEDIQHRSDHQPGDGVSDDLNDVEGKDVLALELTFFDAGALEGEAEDESGHAAGDDPAPPGSAVLQGVAERMADEGDQCTGDRAKQGGEERGHAVGGLDLGFRNG